MPLSSPDGPTPSDVAQALRDPELIASTQVPVLPPVPRPVPVRVVEPVFDAKAMIEATRRNKVENPAYGYMPAASIEGRAAAEELRVKMKRKRRRNDLLGRVLAVAFIAVVAGVGYVLYTMFQADQDGRGAARDAGSSAPLVNGHEPGALTPLGEQDQLIGAIEDLNSGVTPAAGGYVGAVGAAQQAVDQLNGEAGAEASPASVVLSDVLPAGIVAVATELEPRDGLTRYLVVVDDAVRAQPLAAPGWLDRLKSLPQTSPDSAGFAELPKVSKGEIAIAVQSSGEEISRLVVLSTNPAIHIDL